MPSFEKIDIPEDESDGFLDGVDMDQWFNIIRGINDTANFGVRQLTEQVKEGLGMVPEGSAQFLTQELNRDRQILADETAAASGLPGSTGFEIFGEILPLLPAPLGATKGTAALIDGAISSSFFKEDFTESRAGDIAVGAVGGAFARGLFDVFKARKVLAGGGDNAAAAKVAAESTIPNNKSLVPFTAGGRELAPITGGRSLVPSAPVGSRALVPITGNKALTPHIGKSLVPSGGTPGVPIGTKTRVIDPIKQKLLTGRKLDQKLLSQNKNYVKGQQSKALALVTREQRLLQKKLELLTKKLKNFSKADKLRANARFKPLMDRAKQDIYALQLIKNQIKNVPRSATRAAQDLIDGVDAPLRASNATPTTGTSKAQSPRTEPPVQSQGPSSNVGRGQAGVTQSDTLNMLGGAGIGGLLGAAAAPDGQELPFAAAGALGLGVLGRKIGPRLDAKVTERQKRAVADASDKGQEYNVKTLRATKAKDLSKEKLSEVLTGGKKTLDDFLGAIDTRILGIAPKVAHALRLHDFSSHAQAGDWIKRGEGFFVALDRSGMSDVERRRFNKLLFNNRDHAKKYAESKGHTDIANGIDDIAAVLDETAEQLKSVNLGKGLRKGYFPRQVIDTSFFKNIEEVDNYFSHLRKQKGVDLTDFEKENVITSLMNDAVSRGNENVHYAKAAKSLKKRNNKVTDENLDAYADPHQAFNNYAEEIAKQVERRKFFKGQNVKVDDLGPNSENLNNVAVRLKDALKTENLTEQQLDEVAELIRMRFGPGEQASSRAVQNFKNFTYSGLLGNPLSAMTQFGDLAFSAYKNGIANTAQSVVKILANRNNPLSNGLDKAALLGIRDAATDFTSKVASRDILDWSLKYSGFRGADRLGKNTFINAAMLKNQQIPKDEFISKWKGAFDPDAPAGQAPRTEELYQQVQNFQKIDNNNKDTVGFMLWNELADVQPISLSQLPKQYLANPNGRMLYMLQTFTLKMFDVMRRDIAQQVAKKQYGTATKNAARFGAYFVGMNSSVEAAKNFLTNKDATVPDVVVNNTMKLMGLSKYTGDVVAREGIGGALVDTIAPPTAILDPLTDPSKAINLIPPAGRLLNGLTQ